MEQIKTMKIYRAISQLTKPIADSTHDISEIAFYVVEVETMRGVIGQGYLLSFHYSPKAIEGALRDLRNFILSGDYAVYDTVRVKQDYEKECEYFGHEGIQKWAIATLNVAMWDAWGKTLKQPVWRLLGASRTRVPVYGSGGWLSYSNEELLQEVLDYKARGFKAVKIKVGSSLGIAHDMERLTRCREALGPSVNIMMDANQGMELTQALELARQAQSIGLQWFEEPINHKHFEGYQLMRNQAGMAIAMGEREYDLEALKRLVSLNAIDLWQPDLIRLGGVEAWRESAAYAQAHHVGVLPHYYKDYDVPLLCTIPQAFGAESFDWIDGIIDNKMKVESGYAYAREGAGWGFNFKKEYLVEVNYND